MKKFIFGFLLFFLLSNHLFAKDVYLICSDQFFVLQKNGKELVEKESETTLFDNKYSNPETLFKNIFQNERIYIFNNFKDPYSRYYMIDRDTLKIFYKLYYTDERVLFGEKSPKPPSEISVLANEIFDQDVTNQCFIKGEPKI